MILRLPGDGGEFNIHADWIFRTEITDEVILQQRNFQTIIAVDPVTAENGGVEFFLGSHRGELLQNIHDDRSNLRMLDTALRDELCKTIGRMTYLNGFCDAAASDSWPNYLVDGRLVELT